MARREGDNALPEGRRGVDHGRGDERCQIGRPWHKCCPKAAGDVDHSDDLAQGEIEEVPGARAVAAALDRRGNDEQVPHHSNPPAMRRIALKTRRSSTTTLPVAPASQSISWPAVFDCANKGPTTIAFPGGRPALAASHTDRNDSKFGGRAVAPTT